MPAISKIDENFSVQTTLKIDNLKFYNIENEPFTVYGVFSENGKYRRLPEKVAKAVSEGVDALHVHTAGGRVKFITDSPFVAIKAVMNSVSKMPHMPITGSAGFDLYVGRKEVYHKTFIPPFDIEYGYEDAVYFSTKKLREITINFPLYSGVSELFIGLDKNAVVKKSAGYKNKKPIVFYGSSITQGGCASRPGTSYESIISRSLQTDYINFGFSGSAKAEDEITNYINTLDMSVFVYDYDHNAPDIEHLEKTHQKMFLAIRKNHPDLPVVMMSRPKYVLDETEKQRLEIIRKTYNDAVSSGDRNVYLLDGAQLMKYAKNDGTVDGCHPNDAGFLSMAKALIPVLRKIL